MLKYYEAGSVTKHINSYRELLLASDLDTVELVRGSRSDYWAVCLIRFTPIVPSKSRDAYSSDADTLHQALLASSGPRQFRYDRVIVLRRPNDEWWRSTIEFLCQHMPEYAGQGRVFLANLPEDLTWNGLLESLGVAKQLWPSGETWEVNGSE